MGNIGENMANKKRSRKAQELSPEAIAANAEGEARRAREREERTKNNEKQKRFRENMKADGFKQVLLWALPCPADVRDRMAAAGFRQVPAWENETPSPGQTRQAKRRGDPGKIKVAVSVRESSLDAAARLPEVRRALGIAVAEFRKALGKVPEAESLCYDVRELLLPLGDPWGGE